MRKSARRWQGIRSTAEPRGVMLGGGSLAAEALIRPTGAHLFEMKAAGGTLTIGLTRQQALEAERLLAEFRRRSTEVDSGPDVLFPRREYL